MSEPSDLLPALVDSLSESTPVDRDRAFGQAGEGEEVEIVRALKDIAEIASAHRDIWRRDEAREPEALERWGPLLIEGKIGEGGYAEVFRARDPQLHRHVALKLFHPERARQLTKDTLLNEGRGLARLRHENVVVVYGADEQQGRVGIWMEYVEGATLRDVVEKQGRMSADEAVSIGRRLCDALAAVHAKGMVHGDVEAQNVMRQEGEDGGRIVLMDFSSIRSTDRSLPGHEDGKVVGTPLYMAPEIWEEAKPEATSDIYSLGVLLYYMVTGSFPVRARTLEDLRSAHRNRERALLRDARPELPDDFVHVVERALASGRPVLDA